MIPLLHKKVFNFGRMLQARLDRLRSTGVSIPHPIKVSFNLGDGLKIEMIEMERVLFGVASKEKKGGDKVKLLVEPVIGRLHGNFVVHKLTIFLLIAYAYSGG